MSVRVFTSTILIAIAVSHLAGAQPPAAEPKPVLVASVGTEAFRGVLKLEGFEPLAKEDDLYADASQTLLIVLGETSALRGDRLVRYIQGGGAVLIASNSAAGRRNANDWGTTIGLLISGDKLRSSRLDECFRQRDRYPYIDGGLFVDPDLPDASVENLFRGLERIASRDPSYLMVHPQSGFIPIAGFYPSIRTENFVRRLNRDNQVFAVASEVTTNNGVFGPERKGRIIVMADQNVFNNGWLLPSEDQSNDNLEMMKRTIDWLNPEKKRKTCLLMIDGRIETNFNVTLVEQPRPPLPPLPVMANMLFQHGNKIVADLEDRNWFNERVTSRLNYDRFLRNVVLIGTILLAAYGVYRLWRAQTNTETLIPIRLGSYYDRTRKVNHSLASRQEQLIDRDNLYLTVRDFLIQRFSAMGVDCSTDRPPRIATTGTFWERSRVRGQFRKLWRLASGRSIITITAKQWLRIAREMERLETAFERGHWSIVRPIEEQA